MALGFDREWEERFYTTVVSYLEQEEVPELKVVSEWRQHDLQSVEDPRAAELSGNVRRLMEQNYRDAQSQQDRRKILHEVKDNLEQYYIELEERNKY
ncbi:hypothetical protein [Candidatus Nanohalococcus occultus]|uniref:Uncharacterized protein n=1 Tax=Candidatus Nanohalococcus occultus TaxID=2978047 RepID=A0ABY8CEU7_9ARCH|nr:hypothetical protein SVXNc_0731 [Candidatus Nanohaloarchaeota archaeon SVXNc]